jgi:UbiD family decarboxylase
MGRAHKTYKFQVTAITHQKNPIFWSPLAHSFEGINLCKVIRDTCAWEIAERLYPGLVIDVNSLFAFRAIEGVVFQIKKRRRRDESYQKSILQASMGSVPSYTLVIAVDEDVNIYSAEDVMWAIAHRFNASTGLILGPATRGTAYTPLEWAGAGSMAETRVGCLGIDATLPLGAIKGLFKRAVHPVDRVDLTKWLSIEEISNAKNGQCEYAKFLSEKGY